jgi:hypothetical protein
MWIRSYTNIPNDYAYNNSSMSSIIHCHFPPHPTNPNRLFHIFFSFSASQFTDPILSPRLSELAPTITSISCTFTPLTTTSFTPPFLRQHPSPKYTKNPIHPDTLLSTIPDISNIYFPPDRDNTKRPGRDYSRSPAQVSILPSTPLPTMPTHHHPNVPKKTHTSP